MYFDTRNKSDCSGCTTCMNSCPSTAIKMIEDEEGFYYPYIDDEKCIHCDLCRRVCSWEQPSFYNDKEPLAFAAVLSNKTERQRSTSGGLFYEIASWVISQNGIVYGAVFDEHLQLHHKAAETLGELQPMRGSKYIQSNLGDIFKSVKEKLETGRLCFFTGTGCQIAGLKSFLKKEYSNLITADLVCHGVPSQKLFNLHLDFLEDRYRDKVVGYQFRDNKRGRGCEICKFKSGRTLKKPSYELSPYLYSFMHSFTLRLSCYNCKYATLPRQGDITLADYWGIERFFPKFDRENGVSLVLLNNTKGKSIWDGIKTNCIIAESNLSDAVVYNGNINNTTSKPAIRDFIYKEIAQKGYARVASEEFRCPNYLWVSMVKKISNYRVIIAIHGLVRKIKSVVKG